MLSIIKYLFISKTRKYLHRTRFGCNRDFILILKLNNGQLVQFSICKTDIKDTIEIETITNIFLLYMIDIRKTFK